MLHRQKLKLGVLLVLCGLSLAFNLQWNRAWTYRKPATIDEIAAFEKRIAPMRSAFPDHGRIGYRSDREIPEYIIAHGVTPLLVDEKAPACEWLLLNFYSIPPIPPNGYDLVRQNESGVALLRKKSH